MFRGKIFNNRNKYHFFLFCLEFWIWKIVHIVYHIRILPTSRQNASKSPTYFLEQTKIIRKLFRFTTNISSEKSKKKRRKKIILIYKKTQLEVEDLRFRLRRFQNVWYHRAKIWSIDNYYEKKEKSFWTT